MVLSHQTGVRFPVGAQNNIKYQMKILKDKTLSAVFGMSFLILLAFSVFVFLKLSGGEASVIVHFDAYRGIDFFGKSSDVFGILASAAAIVFINALLADFIYNRERFLSYLFAFASLTVSVLILIAVSVIISIN